MARSGAWQAPGGGLRPGFARAALLGLPWIAATVGIVGTWAACARDPGPVAAPPSRGFVVVSLDTLGAKHLGMYGYRRDTSPFLDSLASRSVLFENAFVQYTSTLVSHMSLFTGLYPREHGVYPPFSRLADEVTTLPEAFRQAGFRTAAITEGGYMVGEPGFERGFEQFAALEASQRSIEEVLGRGSAYLEGLEPEERFFLFLHSYAVHDPYNPPQPYDSMFWSAATPSDSGTTRGFVRDVFMGRRILSAAACEHVTSLYDASVRYADDVMAGFFADLDRLGLSEETTVIITSDHGEEFLEHGKLGHHQVYPETIRVPLLVVPPAGAGVARRVASVVEWVDLFPTLCDLADLACPERQSGESFAGLLAGGPEPARSRAYSEVRDQHEMRSLVVRDEAGLHQILTAQRIDEPGGSWFARSIRFDTEGSSLPLRLVSFARPREVEVRVDGQLRETVLVGEAWQEATLELGGPGPHAVELVTDGCDVPMWLGKGEDTRCLSIKVQGAPLGRAELYDLEADPWAERDLSRERTEQFAELLAELQDFEFEPVAAAEAIEPGAATSEQLRALGYVD